jgi:uncharacterized membrane protein YidH (DUF202 family)
MRKDLVCGVILVLVAGGFWVQRDYSSQVTARFPDFVLVVLTLLGVAVIVRGVVVGDRQRRAREVDLRFLAAAVLLLSAWALGTGLIGFSISAVVAFVAMAQLIRRGDPQPRRLATDVGVALVVVVGSFFVFTRVLYVPLPVSVLIGM